MREDNNDSEHQLTSGSGEVNGNGNTKKRKIESVPHDHTSNNLSTELGPTSLHELGSIDLGADNEADELKDLTSWWNSIEDNLDDSDPIGGLDIPLDDLSGLDMFIP